MPKSTEEARHEHWQFDAGPRFEILQQIGAGGMGVVYEAFDRERNSVVALKRLLLLEATQLTLFKNEFRALQDLRHPNLMWLGELLAERGTWFFTMELVRGVDFIAYVRGPRLPEPAERAAPDDTAVLSYADVFSITGASASDDHDDAPLRATHGPRNPAGFGDARLRATLRQVAAGLSALHASGKLHRDIKSSNVLVSDDGRAVILDFGLVTDIARARAAPADGTVMGTAGYMSPEQAAGRPVDAASDWYSFGALLFQGLTGRLPFHGGTGVVLAAKQAIDAPTPSALCDGVPPDLEALCVALLRRDPAKRPRGDEVLRALAADRTSADAMATQPFVGRGDELARLERALADAGAGASVSVLVHGESGLGKSALVREFLQRVARPARAVVFEGRCYERETVPYKGVDQVLDALVAHLAALPDAEADALLAPSAALLPEVFPVFDQVPALARRPAPDAIQDPQELRLRVFAALRELVARTAARTAVVVSLDDLQWADADSLALLGALLREPAPPRVLWLATLRTGTTVTNVESVLRRMRNDVRTIELGRLPPGEAAALVARLVTQAEEPATRVDPESIAREGGGHPLFIDALVRYRLAHADETAPVRLDDAIWWRINRLPAPARRVLEALAVYGAPVAQGLAAQALASDHETFDPLVGTLRAARLVRTAGPRPTDLVEIFHDRVRETVVSRLSPDTLREWHARLALTLELAGHADPERVAVHWRDAGDAARAVDHFLQAATQARQSVAFDRAVRMYREALRLLREDDPAARGVRASLGEALANAGRGGEAGEAYLAAAAREAGDAALDLRRRAAEQFLRAGRVDQGHAVLLEVLAAVGLHLPASRPARLANLALARARLALRGVEPATAHPLTRGEQQRLDVCEIAALGLGMVDTVSGALFQTQTLLLASRAGQPDRLAVAVALEACFLAAQSRAKRPRVQALLAKARRLAERSGDPRALAWIDGGIATTSYLFSEFATGLAACDRAHKILSEQTVGTAWESDSLQIFALWCEWYLGNVPALHERLRTSCHEAAARGDLYALANYRLGYVSNAWLAHDMPARARDEARSAMGGWSKRGYHMQHSYDLWGRGQIALYEGDPSVALRDIAAEWPRLRAALIDRIETTRTYLADLRGRAALADARRGGPDARVKQAHDDGQLLVRANTPCTAPLGELLLGRVAGFRGRDDAARAHLRRAVAGFEANGMLLYRAVAAHRLAELEADPAGRSAALAELERRDVRAPDRMLALLAP